MSQRPPSTIPPAEDESVVQHLTRSVKNAAHQCFGCIMTSDEKAKIKFKEYQIESRKKAFGVEYIDLLQKTDSTPDVLQQAIDKCQDDIQVLQQEIETLVKEIERVNKDTERKLVTKPGTAGATAPPVAAAPENTAAAAPTAPTPPTSETPPAATEAKPDHDFEEVALEKPVTGDEK